MVGGHNGFIARRPVYPLGKGDSWMATIIEGTEDYYEVQRRRTARPGVCRGEVRLRGKLVLTASEAVCRFGAVHTALVCEKRASDRKRTLGMRSTARGGRSETNTRGRCITTG
jgi:hypothetical protein